MSTCVEQPAADLDCFVRGDTAGDAQNDPSPSERGEGILRRHGRGQSVVTPRKLQKIGGGGVWCCGHEVNDRLRGGAGDFDFVGHDFFKRNRQRFA